MQNAKRRIAIVSCVYMVLAPICWAATDKVLSGRDLLSAVREEPKDETGTTNQTNPQEPEAEATADSSSKPVPPKTPTPGGQEWTATDLMQKITEYQASIHSLEFSYDVERQVKDSLHPRREMRSQTRTMRVHYECGYEGAKWYDNITYVTEASEHSPEEREETKSVCNGEMVWNLGGAFRSSGKRSWKSGSVGFAAGAGRAEIPMFQGTRRLSEILRDASRVIVHKKLEDIDGHSCTVINAKGVQRGLWSWRNYRIWIDTKRGFQPLQIERFYARGPEGKKPEKLEWRLSKVELKKADGIWLPVKGLFTTFTSEPTARSQLLAGRRPDLCRIKAERGEQAGIWAEIAYKNKLKYVTVVRSSEWRIVAQSSIRINKPISPEKFTIQFPPGCKVRDRLRRGCFRVDDKGEFVAMKVSLGGGSRFVYNRPEWVAFCNTADTFTQQKEVRVHANARMAGSSVLKLVDFKTSSDKIEAACKKEKGALVFTITLPPDCPKGRWNEYVEMTVRAGRQKRSHSIPIYIVVE